MKKIVLFTILSLSNICFSQTLLLRGDLDPRELMLPSGYKLWSDVEVEKLTNKPLRDDIISTSTLYLENKVSQSDFVMSLKGWSAQGFSYQERILLIDTLEKSSLSNSLKNQWLCRLDLERNCSRIKIFIKHLAPILQKYEWLVLDGKAYPRTSWDEIMAVDEDLLWIFLSSRFETYAFNGKWEDLKFKNPSIQNWISGNCDNYQVLSQVQNLDTNIMIHKSCIRSSIQQKIIKNSFYDSHKDKLWITAGIILGVSAYNSMNGKKIILEKPSFK